MAAKVLSEKTRSNERFGCTYGSGATKQMKSATSVRLQGAEHVH